MLRIMNLLKQQILLAIFSNTRETTCIAFALICTKLLTIVTVISRREKIAFYHTRFS